MTMLNCILFNTLILNRHKIIYKQLLFEAYTNQFLHHHYDY